MKRLALLFALALAAGCASPDRPVGDAEVTWAREALEFQRADVRAEVEERFRKGDLRLKGWVKRAVDTTVICPGIGEAEGAALREVSLAVSEVWYIEDIPPFIIGRSMAMAWERRTAALFDHMQRFNQALFEKLVREGKVPRPPVGR